MEVPTEVGKQVPTPEEAEAEEVPTMEVPTEVGNNTLKDPLGEEQSVDEYRQAVRCQNRAYRVMVNKTQEVPPDEGEDLPKRSLKLLKT